mmetsp:Transcript_18462/g.44105  ORF Transcript_18462/g.44105 Transcript_18462/m.44105 type:complete len:271 (-) Transcript_18462:395-1207(-)
MNSTVLLCMLLALAGVSVFFVSEDIARTGQSEKQYRHVPTSKLKLERAASIDGNENSAPESSAVHIKSTIVTPNANNRVPVDREKDLVTELSQRVCGSPAVDGYSHVVPSCLENSPTAQWWIAWRKSGGRLQDLIVHMEPEADYDGLAVGWGINNKKATAEECAEACRSHEPGPHVGGPFQNLPCNAFVWCPTQYAVCFEPDAHKHTGGDCWLKFSEAPAAPEVNFRGLLPAEYRARHPSAPERVQWVAGVLLPPGTPLTNGTLGPRFWW